MSARAIASQKQKRAGGINEMNKNQISSSSQPIQTRITVPQALKLLEKKIIEIEKLVVIQNNIPNQAELLAQFAKHMNDLEIYKNESQEKIRNLEESIKTLLNQKNGLESELKKRDDLINNNTKTINDIQTIVNKLSLKMLNE